MNARALVLAVKARIPGYDVTDAAWGKSNNIVVPVVDLVTARVADVYLSDGHETRPVAEVADEVVKMAMERLR